MSENQMKDRIVEDLKKAKEAGRDAAKATAEAVGKTAHKLWKRAMDVTDEGISGLWKGAKDALGKKTEK